MTTAGGSAEGKHVLSVVLWTLALTLWGASEAVLLYAKALQPIHAPWSIWTLYLPIMLVLPSLTAIEAYFRFARRVSDSKKDTASQVWSNSFASLLCVTNGTILVCIAMLVSRNY